MSIRITHIVESLERGGLERVVLDLIACQIQAGIPCQVICILRGGVLLKEAEMLGAECVVFEKRKGIDPMLLIGMRKAIVSHQSNVIHTHNAVTHYYAFFSLMLIDKQCFINTRHGMAMQSIRSRRERLYKLAVWRTHYVVSVCNAAKKALTNNNYINPKKCVVVHNGIQLKKFIDSGKKTKPNNEQSMLVIGSVGRLNWAKDYFTLLDAFKILVDEYDDLRLVIAGGGELEKDLKNHAKKLNIKELVDFKGDINEVEKILGKLDIYVMSSITEGYSISLLEACAVGLPIVATDVGGNSEIVNNGKNGFIVPASNHKELASNIKILLQDLGKRLEFSSNGRSWAKEYASSETMHENYLSLYEKCISIE